MNCREIAEEFKIGKAQTANVVANEARAEYENFQGKSYKHTLRGNHLNFKSINDMLYSWYKKCETSSIYVIGSILKEKSMNIKSLLNQSVLENFRASDGWLDKWKLNHGIREKQISEEFLGVLETTVESWMERIKELCTGYQCQNIWNMDNTSSVISLKKWPKKERKQKVAKD